ncbi:MAG TPA: M50 family metallopeptidase [Thermoanaerobaculia bacterium]|nr:M50 family metallopeptidase [Thermoanaerobaculia bacterium]
MLNLGSIRGTSMHVDFNFIILVAFFALINYDERAGIQYALLWIPIVFVSVLVHELAHAAAYGMFGFGPSRILLTGMGGLTFNDSRDVRPWQDVVISVAGPASSFGLMLLSAWLQTTGVGSSDRMLTALLPRMALACFFWGMFNLIPLKPLDGGHAIHSFFRIFLDPRRAFTIATWIGIVAGAGTVVYFLLGRQIFLALFIAWFIYMAWQRWEDFRRSGIPGD